jgi:hypothetical protein
MPTLTDEENIYDNEQPLSVALNLLNLEVFQNQTTDGWIHYELRLTDGKRSLVELVGTLHDSDVRMLEKMLNNLADDSCDFEPLEPDFTFALEYLEDEEDWGLTCMVNYGAAKHKYYGTTAIGFRLKITKLNAQKFASQLKDARVAITKDEDFTGFVTKSIKDNGLA